MTTEQIDQYLAYFEAAQEGYAIPRAEAFKYSEYSEESDEDETQTAELGIKTK